MGANNHKVINAINVIQSLPDRVVGTAQTLKAMFDNVGEIVRLKHNDLCDYIDTDVATKAEVSTIILGQITDGTITTSKLDPDALQANVTKLSSGTATMYGLTNVDDALALIQFAKHYGKYSQMSGGVQKIGPAQSGIITFTTEDNDNFSAINIGNSNSRITIPTGVTRAKFYWHGEIERPEFSGWIIGGSIKLYKNGVEVQKIVEHTSEDGFNICGTFFSTPISCTSGDHFELYATLGSATYAGSTVYAKLLAGSIFGMEIIQ